MMIRLICVAIGYVFGLFQTSYIYGKMHGIDIRTQGSGNAGTTNVLRVLGKKAAFITLVIDIAKGFLAVRLGMLFGYETGAVCAVAVFCGHIWPCFYRFKGGKGVATAFGALLAINWMLGLTALAIVAAGLFISKRMSVGSILGAITFPLVCYYLEPEFLYEGSLMALIILIKHRANIGRLLRGEEPPMGIFKSKEDKK